MTVLWHDSGIPQGLCPTAIQYDYAEERIAELVEQTRTIVALGRGWWLYPQVNMISNKHQNRTRCGYTAHNWHLYMRSGWYWAKQNTGRMDTPRPPVSLAVASMAKQGGNYSGKADCRAPSLQRLADGSGSSEYPPNFAGPGDRSTGARKSIATGF